MKYVFYTVILLILWSTIYDDCNPKEKIGMFGTDKSYIAPYDNPYTQGVKDSAKTFPKKTGQYIPPNGWTDINE